MARTLGEAQDAVGYAVSSNEGVGPAQLQPQEGGVFAGLLAEPSNIACERCWKCTNMAAREGSW